MKNKLLLYAETLGLVTLVAILATIRDRLLALAPWVLAVLLIVLGLVVAYLLYALYSLFHKKWHEIQHRSVELEERTQKLRIEGERWEVEKHLMLTRLHLDPNGNAPYIIRPEMELLPSQQDVLMLPAGQIRGGSAPKQQEQEEESEKSALPMGVRYEQIAHKVPRGHGLLGLSETGVETADFQEFMTMLISGGSNSGKSNTVGLKLHEAIQNGRDIRLLVIDWHARKEDSLYNKIRAYESRFLMPVVTEEEQTLPVLQKFYNEFKRRRAEGVTRRDHDILLVIDEVPGMMDAEDEEIPRMLKKIARMSGREGRGFGVYAWFIAQQVIGMSWLRNVVHTCICHKATRMNEAVEACNQHKDIARDMENWPAGRVVVYGQNFQGVRVLQMPVFTPPPVIEAGRGSGAVYVEEIDEMEELQPNVPETLQRDSERENNFPSNVRTFPKNVSQRLPEQPEATSEERPREYRLSDVEIQQFIAAYKVSGSIDKSLQAIGRGARYRQHASEIVTAYNLRQNA